MTLRMQTELISISEAQDFAQLLADASRSVCLKYFRNSVMVEDKADASPVTQADMECETMLRAMINEKFPDHGILGEEHGQENLDKPYVWVIDPIDGTRAFATGFPVYGTLIALLADGKPVCGVCDLPSLRERFVGGVGAMTRFNGRRCETSSVTKLSDATLRFTSHEIFSKEEFPAVQKIMDMTRFTHSGGDCYNYTLLAAGQCDLVIESSLQLYDIMALLPIVEGAGGIISDWQGKPIELDREQSYDGRIVAAATQELHEQAIQHLSKI
ncbi:MAG: histidinol-phosphatase [Alphaproteobacteria bacterium]